MTSRSKKYFLFKKYLKRVQVHSTLNGNTIHYIPIPALRDLKTPKYEPVEFHSPSITVGTHAMPPVVFWVKQITAPNDERSVATDS